MGTPLTATRILEEERSSRLKATIHHMLYKLRDFVDVFTADPDAKLPEHDVVWVTHVSRGGPETVIRDAILSCPAMWLEALPEDVVIVPRRMLEQVGLSADVIDALSGYGTCMVDTQAAMHEHTLESRERAHSTLQSR